MDFQWFLTIPGLLISGGVLLLIIALIIFISTSSKKVNKADKVSDESLQGAKELVNNAETTPPVASDNLGVQMDNSIAQPNGIENLNTTVAPEVDVNALENTPVQEVPTEMPAVEANAPVMDTITPAVEASAPVMDTVTSSEMPEIPIAASQDNQIYGGANPTSNIDINNNETHEIYGGANPLENTQINLTPPTSEIPQTSGVASMETQIDTPVADVSPVSPEPIAAPSNPVMPEVAPAVEAPIAPEVTPVVESSPVAPIESVTEQPSVAPVTPEVTPVVEAPITPEVAPISETTPVVDISTNNQ